MSNLKEDIENFIPEVEQHVRSWFEARAPQIDRGIKLAEMADADPLIQGAEAALGIPAPARAAFADFLAKLDAEFTRVASESHEAGRQAARDAQAAELAAAVPAEGPDEPPAE